MMIWETDIDTSKMLLTVSSFGEGLRRECLPSGGMRLTIKKHPI